LGDITYGLKATVERPKFSMNYTSKKSVNIHRVLVPSSLEYTQSLLISNTWVDKLSYDISAPSRVFTPGSLIPITFSLHPIAQELRVKSASCTLQEFITLSTSDHTITEGKDINSIKDENFSTGPDRWIKTEMLSIPDIQSQLLHKDTHSDLLEVKHKLAFSVSLINADGHLSGKTPKLFLIFHLKHLTYWSLNI
jgi:hypothetical protein